MAPAGEGRFWTSAPARHEFQSLWLRPILGRRIVVVDISPNMLARAGANVARAWSGGSDSLSSRRYQLLYEAVGEALLEAVVSNTIIHHIPEPAEVLRAMKERTSPGGTLLVRDLARPVSLSDLDRLVLIYAGNESPRAHVAFSPHRSTPP